MSECIFCKIVKRDIPSTFIYEDEHFVAFLDINPMNKGHVLVVPREHYDTMMDLPHDLASKMMPVVQKLTQAVMDATGNEKFNWYVVGDEVAHAHLHIVPRFEGDQGPVFKTTAYDSDHEREALAQKIKENAEMEK